MIDFSNADKARNSILTNDRALERALVLVFAGQTADERDRGATKHSNGLGFNYHDASTGTYMARWIVGARPNDTDDQIRILVRNYIIHQSGGPGFRTLTGRFVGQARRMMIKYAGQVARVSEAFAQAGIGRPAPVEVVVEALPTTPPALPPVEASEEAEPFRLDDEEINIWFVRLTNIVGGREEASSEVVAIANDWYDGLINLDEAAMKVIALAR